MKKVLIVTYFFPPNTTIVSSFRPYSWYNEFQKHSLLPIVVTRHWNDQPLKSTHEILSEDLREKEVVVDGDRKIYYLPFQNTDIYRQANKKSTSLLGKVTKKAYEMAGLLTGRFTNEPDLYFAFKKEIIRIVEIEKPAVVIFSALPVSLVRLAAFVKSRFNISVVIDFKDFWNNNLLNDNYKFSGRAKFYFFIQELYIKKWLRDIDLVVSVSQPILDKIKKHTPATAFLLHNGYERELFKEIAVEEDEKVFTIVLTGMLYSMQDWRLLVNGFNRFLESSNYPENVCLYFIGLDYVPELADNIRKLIPAKNLVITNRLPRKEALKYMKKASILLYAGWKGWRGIYSGKIFEYLGARRNILLAPGDNNVLDALLHETKAGRVVNSEEEMASVLEGWFTEWKIHKKLAYQSDEGALEYYTREALAERFAVKLKCFFNL